MACGRLIMGCTTKPSILALLASTSALPVMSRTASITACSEDRSSATPPTSLLCVIWRDRIFTATGKPMRSAAAAASAASSTTSVGTTGMP